MIVTIAVGLCVAYVIYSWFTMKPKNFPPGPPCLPIVGSALSLPRKHIHLHMVDWRKKYGPLVGFIFGSKPLVAVCEPKSVQEVLKRDEFQLRPDTFLFRSRSFHKRLGVFFSDGSFWVEQRRFTLRNLRDFGFGKNSEENIIHEEVGHLIKKMESSKIVSNCSLFNLSFINVLWVALAGNRISSDDDSFRELIDKFFDAVRLGDASGGLINAMPFLRHVFPNLGGFKTLVDVSKELQDFIKKIILEHEKTLVPESPRDFIDVYIREKKLKESVEGSTFTDEALIVTCMDLFGAGVESTSNTLNFALMYMMLHPEVQRKVHEELDTVVGKDRPVYLSDRTSLPYVEAALTESMRCNTIAPIAPPHRSACDTHLDGYFIPKDTVILASLWSLLQDKEHWGDPENFRPERFIGADGKFVKDEWMINFGMGKRVCLGEPLARNSTFLFFACLMQRFNFSIPPGDPKPSTLSLPGFTMAPQPFKMKVESRL